MLNQKNKGKNSFQNKKENHSLVKIKALRLQAKFGMICLSILLAAAAFAFAGAHNLYSIGTGQWPFDPSGYFYPKERLPDDIDHILLLRNYKGGDDRPIPGVYTARGEVYKFAALRIEGTPDFRQILFEFTTTSLNGISYRYAGEFLNNHIYEEYVTDPTEIVAKGKFLKLENGKIITEIPVQFTYSPKLRNLTTDVNTKYPSGRTDLMYAAANGDIVKVQALLAQGANVNARGPDGRTALEYVMHRFKKEEELVEVLIAAGANVNFANDRGETVLMYATYSRGKMVNLLLAAGADVNARAKDGRTALIHAVQAATSGTGSIENLKTLIGAGADVNARDKFGRTALSIAEKEHNQEIVSILKQAGKK
jgi:hypothetical protein